MPGRRKRKSNTHSTEAPPKRGRPMQRTKRVTTEVSAPVQDIREWPENLLTKDDIPMVVKAVLDSIPPSQATSTTATRIDSTGQGTGETPTERARAGSESIRENRAQHQELTLDQVPHGNELLHVNQFGDNMADVDTLDPPSTTPTNRSGEKLIHWCIFLVDYHPFRPSWSNGYRKASLWRWQNCRPCNWAHQTLSMMNNQKAPS